MSYKFIFGLGNPGPEYKFTRHNIGFLCLDYIFGDDNWQQNKNLNVLTKTVSGIKLFKPQTFMNASGSSVLKVLSYYKASSKDILVIYDDIDMAVGNFKHKKTGGHGGHNGIRDIIKHIGADFLRLKVGVGRPLEGVANYVLSKPSISEFEQITQVFANIANEYFS